MTKLPALNEAVSTSAPAAQRTDEAVTPQAGGDGNILGKEEKVEYRDQGGNLLNEEQVQALMKEGKATFETKYETRTRLVDELGNEVPDAFGPAHPDVEGQNPDTKGLPEGEGKRQPASANAGSSLKGERLEAKPASDANAATK